MHKYLLQTNIYAPIFHHQTTDTTEHKDLQNFYNS